MIYLPPADVVDAMTAAAARANRYPEVYPHELVAAIARHHSVPADHITVGAGASGLIQQMLHLVARAKGTAICASALVRGLSAHRGGHGSPGAAYSPARPPA
ncbi:hypothetical protein ACWGI9_41070 [Streptomyces sp. NPDC054833]